jgi:hypothetical protein
MPLSRRHVLAGGAVTAALVGARSTAHAATAWNFNDPQTALDAYVRMRNRDDGKKSYTRYSGTFFAKVEGETAVPILGIEGMSWGTCKRQDDGTYVYSMQEAGYHTRLGTTEIVDEWDNPITGATVQPRHYRSGQTSVFAPGAVLRPNAPPVEGLEFKGVISPITVIGDTAWGSEDLYVKFPNPRERYNDEQEWSGPFRVANSLATHSALVADIINADRDFVPSTMAYTTLNSWRPWMKMGQTPGIISWRLKGRKFESADEIGDWLLDRVANDHPDLLEA